MIASAALEAPSVLYGEVVDDIPEPDEGPRYVACFVHTFFSRACWLASAGFEGCRVVDAWLVSHAIAPRRRHL